MISLVTGVLLVRALTSGSRSFCRHDILRVLLGTGLGVGIGSCCYFFGLLFQIPTVLLELFLLVCAGAAALRWRRAKCPFCVTPETPGRLNFLTATLAIAFSVLLILDVQAFVWTVARARDGQWDAWAIWNLRARFLYRDGGLAWRDGFTPLLGWSRPDYPLLLPASIAGFWKTIGHETQTVPIALGAFFSFGSAGLMAASVSVLRGVRQGMLAGLTLAATPAVFVQGAAQYADVPLSFFLLATLAAISLADRFESAGMVVVSGLAAALAGWTKNDGLMWFVCFFLALLIVSGVRKATVFVAGAAPVLVVILLFKTQVATPNYIFVHADPLVMMGRLLDLSRYAMIARKTLIHMWYFGPLMLSPFVILTVFLFVVGLRPDTKDVRTLRTAILALALTAAGYFMIYVLNPIDLSWMLMMSVDRLILHLWPGVVFTAFLAARDPEPLSRGIVRAGT